MIYSRLPDLQRSHLNLLLDLLLDLLLGPNQLVCLKCSSLDASLIKPSVNASESSSKLHVLEKKTLRECARHYFYIKTTKKEQRVREC